MSSDGHAAPDHMRDARCLKNIDVFVLAGGLGTRIAPVLGRVPKLLAPIAERPYLAYLLEWLLKLGAKRVVLGLGHEAQAIIDFLKRDTLRYAGLSVEVVVEPRPLGTAGAVRFARAHLFTNPVLIMNGDSFVDVNLCEFVEYHRRSKATATLLCTEVDDAGRYGRVELDDHGHIRGFVEKDPDFHGSSPVSAGVYLFSAKFLDEIAATNASSLEHDVFGGASAGSLDAFTGRFAFVDIGTPDSLSIAGKIIVGTPGSAA